MGYVYYVNNSGVGIPVYHLQTREVIGSINSRESFLRITGADSDGMAVQFVNSSGNWALGFILDTNRVTNWLNVPYYNLEGKLWFKARYDMPIYSASDYTHQIATVKAGEYVWLDRNQPGSNRKDLIHIRGYREYVGKQWNTFNDTYAYVDTGIMTCGSGGSYIGIYGNW